MNIIKKLFGKINLVTVRNEWGIADGADFLVERQPDLKNIFTSDNPPSPWNPTQEKQRKWASMSLSDKRFELAMAYLGHPDPQVRASTIPFVKGIDAIGIQLRFKEMLSDRSPIVQSAATQVLRKG